MCMYAKTKATTAEKDIPCWKMLEIVEGKDGNPMYVTPYQFKPVPPEVMRGEETLKPDEKPFYYPEDVTIDRGFIHTYGGEIDPRDAINILLRNCGMIGAWETYITLGVIESMSLECETAPKILGMAFCEAVIPKGASYIEGDTEMPGSLGAFAYVPGYASSEIRITGIGCEFRHGEYVPTQIPEKVYEAMGARNRPEEKQE